MARIQVQKREAKKQSPDDILTRFCYYFPQYTLQEARKIPQKRIVQMLKVVDKEQSIAYLMLLRIVTSPHTKKGAGVKKLAQQLKANIE